MRAHQHHGWRLELCVCVLIYECAPVSIQTLWQARRRFVTSFKGRAARMCAYAGAFARYVCRHFWECDCIPVRNVCFHRHVRTVWVCAVAIPLHSESRSLKPHQRVCGRQNDKARNQPASAWSHTQAHTHTHTLALTHQLIDTYCPLRALFRRLTHTHTHMHANTFNTNRH